MLLDANALLMPFQFRINLETELRRILGEADIAVPTPVVAELEALGSQDRIARSAARLASSFRTIDAHGSADDALMDLGKAHRAIVVTNDAALLDRLRSAHVPVAFLRSKNHLVVEGL